MGAYALRVCGKVKWVTIEKWSVQEGRSEGTTSHLVIRSRILAVQKRLSGREKRLELICCRVGLPLSSTISISYSASMLMSLSAALCACAVKRCVSSSLSHRGWCLLKLLAQI